MNRVQSKDLFSCCDKASRIILGSKGTPPFVVNIQKLLCDECMHKFTGEHKEFCPICFRSYLNDKEVKALEHAQKQSRGALRPLDDLFPAAVNGPERRVTALQASSASSGICTPGRNQRSTPRSSPFATAALRSPSLLSPGGGLEEGMGDGMVSIALRV